MLPPEIDQPQILGLLLRSDRANELNSLWQLLERNTLSLKRPLSATPLLIPAGKPAAGAACCPWPSTTPAWRKSSATGRNASG